MPRSVNLREILVVGGREREGGGWEGEGLAARGRRVGGVCFSHAPSTARSLRKEGCNVVQARAEAAKGIEDGKKERKEDADWAKLQQKLLQQRRDTDILRGASSRGREFPAPTL